MLLGDLINAFDDEAVAAETILRIGDLALIAAMREQADAIGLDLGAFAAATVRRYADEASDEEWTTLIGQMGRAADPGAVCLKRAFAHAIQSSPG
jgi:hypothetical protein